MATREHSRRGGTLIMVLLLVMTMSVLVLSLGNIVIREVSQTANVRDDTRAVYLAEMGLVRGQVMLMLDEHADYDSLNEIWTKSFTWEGETFGDDSMAGQWGSGGSFGGSGSRAGRSSRFDEHESAGGGGSSGAADKPPEVFIVDEERKFNLLTLVRGNNEQKRMAAEVLTRLIEICRRQDDRLILDGQVRRVRRIGEDSMNPDTLVRNLIRYLEERPSDDAGRMEMDFGPEDEIDQRSMRKQTPYEMLTISELLLVEGWTRELLHGPARIEEEEDPYERDFESRFAGRRGSSEVLEREFEEKRRSIEAADERSRDPDPIGLIHYITLYSTGRININTAAREVLLALSPDITWETVERIITAREQDRRDVIEAEETGELPMAELPGADEEVEDNASFRPQDLANYQAFVSRVNNEMPEGGEQAQLSHLDDFNEEIYNAIRPWLTVISSVFTVESSATVGKVTHSLKAVFRRSNVEPQQPQGNNGAPQQPQQPTPLRSNEDALPPMPEIRLTLLFRRVTSN
jgi:hypothetical protein